MHECEKPVIVALNGTAAGGGAMLVLAADLVIAADSASIIQVFVRRGPRPRRRRHVPPPPHRRHAQGEGADVLRRRPLRRRRAPLGIVNKVVPAAELEAATTEWAERLASGPTKAIGWTKKLLHDGVRMTLAQLVEEEAMFVEMNSSTVDSAEGVAAFHERRDRQMARLVISSEGRR